MMNPVAPVGVLVPHIGRPLVALKGLKGTPESPPVSPCFALSPRLRCFGAQDCPARTLTSLSDLTLTHPVLWNHNMEPLAQPRLW